MVVMFNQIYVTRFTCNFQENCAELPYYFIRLVVLSTRGCQGNLLCLPFFIVLGCHLVEFETEHCSSPPCKHSTTVVLNVASACSKPQPVAHLPLFLPVPGGPQNKSRCYYLVYAEPSRRGERACVCWIFPIFF